MAGCRKGEGEKGRWQSPGRKAHKGMKSQQQQACMHAWWQEGRLGEGERSPYGKNAQAVQPRHVLGSGPVCTGVPCPGAEGRLEGSHIAKACSGRLFLFNQESKVPNHQPCLVLVLSVLMVRVVVQREGHVPYSADSVRTRPCPSSQSSPMSKTQPHTAYARKE